MSIQADFRRKELRDKSFLFMAVTISPRHFVYNSGQAFATLDEASAHKAQNGYIVRLHKNIIQGLKRMNAYKRGLALSYHLRNRSE